MMKDLSQDIWDTSRESVSWVDRASKQKYVSCQSTAPCSNVLLLPCLKLLSHHVMGRIQVSEFVKLMAGTEKDTRVNDMERAREDIRRWGKLDRSEHHDSYRHFSALCLCRPCIPSVYLWTCSCHRDVSPPWHHQWFVHRCLQRSRTSGPQAKPHQLPQAYSITRWWVVWHSGHLRRSLQWLCRQFHS